jgi:hypothetical protein
VAGRELHRGPGRQLRPALGSDRRLGARGRTGPRSRRKVRLDHVWAIEKRSALVQWVSATSELLSGAGFDQIAHRIVSFRSGQGLVLRAEKLQLCNRKAP